MHDTKQSQTSRHDEIQDLLKTPIHELIPHLNRDQLLELLKKYFFNIQAVMFLTGLSRTHIWQLRKKGKLRACKNTGRRPLFTLDAILECFKPE